MNKEYTSSNSSPVVRDGRPYIIVRAEEVEYLSDTVSTKIKQGYAPYGNPFVYNERVCQAMIKE